MTTDLTLTVVVDGDLVDDQCQQTGMPYCPGDSTPPQWMPDPFDSDCGNTTRLVNLHPACATQLAADN